jgi:hypothetical protein
LRRQEAVVVASASDDTTLDLMRLAVPELPARLSRSHPPITGDVGASDELRQLLESWGVRGEAEGRSVVASIAGALTIPPIEPSTGDSLLDATAALFLELGPTERTRTINTFTSQDPDVVARLDGQVLRSPHQRATTIEHYEAILTAEQLGELTPAMTANEAGDHPRAIGILEGLLQKYPWSAILHQELGVNLDQGGTAEAAIEPLIRAIVLEHRDSVPWQSLSVVLRRLNAERESRLALAVGAAVSEVEHKYALD